MLPKDYAVRSTTTVEVATVELSVSRFAKPDEDQFIVNLTGAYGNKVILAGSFSELAAFFQVASGVLGDAACSPAMEYPMAPAIEHERSGV